MINIGQCTSTCRVMYYQTEVAKVAPILFSYRSTYDIHHDKYLESFRAPGLPKVRSLLVRVKF